MYGRGCIRLNMEMNKPPTRLLVAMQEIRVILGKMFQTIPIIITTKQATTTITTTITITITITISITITITIPRAIALAVPAIIIIQPRGGAAVAQHPH